MEIITYFAPCPAQLSAGGKHSKKPAQPRDVSVYAEGPAVLSAFEKRLNAIICATVNALYSRRSVLLVLLGLSVLFLAGAAVYSIPPAVRSPLVLAHIPEADLQVLDMAMADFTLTMDEITDSEASVVPVPPGTLFSQPVSFQEYKVKSGDTISGISHRYGLGNISTLISVNQIDNTRLLRAGQSLQIPSIDGIYHTVAEGDSLEGLSARYGTAMEDILDINDLSDSVLHKGQKLFIPGAVLDARALKKALGELFVKPLEQPYRLTSAFGNRSDPFTGVKSFHTGIDMAIAQGTPIKAAMSGKVAAVGFTNVYGHYTIINHENGYQTLYAHMMTKPSVKTGQRISQGQQIGLVGSTGYSTGPHLHFTVYKNGKLIDPLSVLK